MQCSMEVYWLEWTRGLLFFFTLNCCTALSCNVLHDMVGHALPTRHSPFISLTLIEPPFSTSFDHTNRCIISSLALFPSFTHALAYSLPPPPPNSQQDMWYATPLSEIDFSQCRKCTPSYRALPKSYPKPVCSERSEVEASLLNDVVRKYLCVCMFVSTYVCMNVFFYVCFCVFVRTHTYICSIKRNAERLRGHSYINYNDILPVTHFFFVPFKSSLLTSRPSLSLTHSLTHSLAYEYLHPCL